MIDGLPPRFPIAGQPEATKVRWFLPYPIGGQENPIGSGTYPASPPTPLAAFGVYYVRGCHFSNDGRLYLHISQEESGHEYDNPYAIAVASFDGGLVTMDGPFVALVKTSDRDAGTVLSLKGGTNYFQKDHSGSFVSLGLDAVNSVTSFPAWATSSSAKATLVARRSDSYGSILFKTQSGAGVGSRSGTTPGSGTVDVYFNYLDAFATHTLTDTGEDVVIYNMSSNAVGTSKYGIASREPNSSKFWVVSAEGWTP